MTGNSGKYLTTDGTNSSWAAVPSPNNGTLSLSTSGTGISGSATFTADQSGSSSFTVTSNATSSNTVSTIVARDASGNFNAGTITAALSGSVTGNVTGNVTGSSGSCTGNAATATQWATGRTITLTGDVTGTSGSFDGSGNLSFATTIAANSVALGTDTTGNYVASITNGSYLTGGNGGSEGAALTLAVDATNANTASKVVARDASGNFSAGTITAALTGNASTATTLETARTINDVSFNGSEDITVTANTPNTLTRGTYLTGLDFNGSAATTWAVDATNANTASKVVARDASGDFSAGTITAALTGNASTATTLQTARTINGVSFNGSADITVEPYIEDDEATDATRYLIFTDDSTAGYKRLNEDSSLTYNPSTGNLTTNGTVSAGSDERWKENWKEFGPNFIDELAQVKHGTYSRIDTKEIQVGVGAQSLQKVIPEAVNQDDKGYLNVAYGHAALASVVELAKEVVKLRAEIAELKSRSK